MLIGGILGILVLFPFCGLLNHFLWPGDGSSGIRIALVNPALTAYDGDRAIRVSGPDILRFFTDGKTVSVETEEGVFGVRERIYQLEEKYCTGRFVRVSQSEIVNLDKVTAIDLSLTGTVRMQMTSGSSAYVSRRYMRKIREAIGL